MDIEPLIESPLTKPRSPSAFNRDSSSITSPAARSPKRPTLVNLEGGDWLLTTLLITLDAVLLELYKSENTRWATFLTWFIHYECGGGWVCELLNTLYIMAVAIANVILLIPVINVNVRTPSRKTWRGWLVFAWTGLLLVDAMTVLQVQDSIRKCISPEEEDVDSWTAHFWLIGTALVLAVVLNIRFVYLYGCFTCMTCNGDRQLRKREGLRQIYVNSSRRRRDHSEARQQMHANTQSLLNVVRAPQLHRFNTGEFLEQVATGFRQFVGRKVRFVRTTNLNIARGESVDSNADFQEHLHRLLNVDYLTTWRAYIGGKLKHMYTEVAEVENVFEYSSWIKAAAIFAVLMLIYNCIKTTEILFTLASSWDDFHNLATRFQNGLSSTRDTLGVLDQNLTAISDTTASYNATVTAVANETLPSVVQEISQLQGILGELDKATGSAYDVAGAMLDVALLTTATLVNITDLEDNPVVGAFFYVDSIIPILRYTCIVGYPIGTLIGLHSLYQVLVQHKRMSLALEQALSARTPQLMGKLDVDEEDARETLLGIDKKYEIGGAVYFFGILMSTAVVQQHIFGFAVTVFVAMIINMKNFDVLLNIGGYLIFVYLAVMITNLFLTHIIGDRLLTKRGFQIQHPWLFFLYLFTFSMVHAVLGFLYALWRAMLLLVTTFWVLNRLDVSLFLTGKQFDNGHYSFMSMLLLTRVIRLTNIAQGPIQAPNGQNPDAFSESSLSGDYSSQLGGMFPSNELSFDANENGDDEMSIVSPSVSLTFNPGAETSPRNPNGEIEADNDADLPPPSVSQEDISISVHGENSTSSV